MVDEKTDCSYQGNTTERDRKFDAENLMSNSKAVFPELPEPFNHMYVKFRDLNSDSNCSQHTSEFRHIEDLHEHPAVEVGIKYTF